MIKALSAQLSQAQPPDDKLKHVNARRWRGREDLLRKLADEAATRAWKAAWADWKPLDFERDPGADPEMQPIFDLLEARRITPDFNPASYRGYEDFDQRGPRDLWPQLSEWDEERGCYLRQVHEISARYEQLQAARDAERDARVTAIEKLQNLGVYQRDTQLGPGLFIGPVRLDATDADMRQAARVCQFRAGDLMQIDGIPNPHIAAQLIAAAAHIHYESIRLDDDPDTARRQLLCEFWWRRIIRSYVRPRRADLDRAMGTVKRYCSPHMLHDRKEQLELNQKSIDKLLIVDQETGETFKLAKLVEQAGERRAAELWARIFGTMEFARKRGLRPVLGSITLESRYHARTADGRVNPQWDGSTVGDGLDRLLGDWRRVRAHGDSQSFQKQTRGFEALGFRAIEPHTDGTAHLHLAAWVSDIDEFRKLLDRHFIERDADAKRRKHAVDLQAADSDEGCALYALCYALKSQASGQLSRKLKHEPKSCPDDRIEKSDGRKRVEAWRAAYRRHGWDTWRIGNIKPAKLIGWREAQRKGVKVPSDHPLQPLFDCVNQPSDGDGHRSGVFAQYMELCQKLRFRGFTALREDRYGRPARRLIGLIAISDPRDKDAPEPTPIITRVKRWVILAGNGSCNNSKRAESRDSEPDFTEISPEAPTGPPTTPKQHPRTTKPRNSSRASALA